MQQAGGGCPLFEQGPRRRHALPDGPRLDRQGTGVRRGAPEGAQPGGEGAGVGAPRRKGTALPEGEERHPRPGAQPSQCELRTGRV